MKYDLGKYSSFITKLHEEDIFDMNLFEKYIEDCNKVEVTSFANKHELKENILEIIDIFEYTAFRFYYHLDSTDLSQITNYNHIIEEVPFIETSIRSTTNKLLTLL